MNAISRRRSAGAVIAAAPEMIIRRYTLKLYPRPAQAAALDAQRLLCGELWNGLIQRCEDVYRRERRLLTAFDLSKEITTLRAECPEFAAIPVYALRSIAQRVTRGYQTFFALLKRGDRHARPPTYARTANAPGFGFGSVDRAGWSFQPGPGGRNGRLYLKGVGKIRMRGLLPEGSEPRTCDITFREGGWWLSLAVRRTIVIRPELREAGVVTLDLVSKFARITRADGECIAGPEARDAMVFRAIDGRIILQFPGDNVDPGADPGELGDGCNRQDLDQLGTVGADPGELGDGCNVVTITVNRHHGADPGELQKRMARCRRGSNRYRRLRLAKARGEARQARQRLNLAHNLARAIARCFGDVSLTAPESIKDVTRSGRGSRRSPGAEVRFKAAFNRRILLHAPGRFIALVEEKITESGGRFERAADIRPPAQLGNMVVIAAKTIRDAKRRNAA